MGRHSRVQAAVDRPMSIRTYSLHCLSCAHKWMSTKRDEACPFCGSKAVADTGGGKG